jgi:hypothetical protein
MIGTENRGGVKSQIWLLRSQPTSIHSTKGFYGYVPVSAPRLASGRVEKFCPFRYV